MTAGGQLLQCSVWSTFGSATNVILCAGKKDVVTAAEPPVRPHPALLQDQDQAFCRAAGGCGDTSREGLGDGSLAGVSEEAEGPAR